MKGIYEKLTANIKLAEFWIFPLRLGTRQGWLLSPLAFDVIPEVLTSAKNQEEERNDTNIGKEEVKHSLSADNVIVYVGSPKDSKFKNC